MYYSRVLGRIIIDKLDIYLVSAAISIYITEYGKFYFSEEEKMRRLREDLINSSEEEKMRKLREDLINKSKLVKSFSQKKMPYSVKMIHRMERIQKIYNLALRGGNDEVLLTTSEKIKALVLYLLSILQKKTNDNKLFNLILSSAGLYLQFLLLLWRIHVLYCVDPLTGETIIVTMVAGGTTGMLISWLGIGATLFAHLLVGIFVGRSSFQQLNRFIVEKKLQIIFQKTLANQKKKLEENQRKLEMITETAESLGVFEENPGLKETAEGLGVFEKNPGLKETVESLVGERLGDPDLKETAEGLGLFKKNRGPYKSTENYLYKRYLKKKAAKAAKKVFDGDENPNFRDVDFVNEDLRIPPIRVQD